MNREVFAGAYTVKPLLPLQNVTASVNGTGVDVQPYSGPAIVILDTAAGVAGSHTVNNSGFAIDTLWTKGPGWSISNGVASCDGTQTGTSEISQKGSVNSSTWYHVTFTVSNYQAGTVKFILSGTSGTVRSANGTFSEAIYYTSGGSDPRFVFQANADFIGSIDNVVIKYYSSMSDFVSETFVFDNWVRGKGWSIAGGKASIDGSNASTSDLSWGQSNLSGAKCIEFTITDYVSGTFTPYVGGVAGTARSGNGTFVETITAGATTLPSAYVRASAGAVGSVSVFKATTQYSDSVVNGTFADASGWTYTAPWVISGGVASIDGSQSAEHILYRDISITNNYRCYVKYTISGYGGGAVRVRLKGVDGVSRSANGTHEEVIAATTGANIEIIADADFIGTIDNVVAAPIGASPAVNFYSGTSVVGPALGDVWAISGGTANLDGSQTGASTLELVHGTAVAAATIYAVKGTITNYAAGTITPYFNGAAGSPVSANGAFVQFITCPSSTNTENIRYVADADFSGSIDNLGAAVASSATVNDAGFANDAAWDVGPGWAISGTVATHSAGQSTATMIATNMLTLTAGRTYTVGYTVSGRTAGTVTVSVGGAAGTARSTNATHTEAIVCGSGTDPKLAFTASTDFDGSIDNVTVTGCNVTVSLEESADDVTYAAVSGWSFPVATHTAGTSQKKTVIVDERQRYLRAVATLDGGIGSMYVSASMLVLPE